MNRPARPMGMHDTRELVRLERDERVAMVVVWIVLLALCAFAWWLA